MAFVWQAPNRAPAGVWVTAKQKGRMALRLASMCNRRDVGTLPRAQICRLPLVGGGTSLGEAPSGGRVEVFNPLLTGLLGVIESGVLGEAADLPDAESILPLGE